MRGGSCTLALAVVAVAAVIMFAQADELKDLSSADVAPQVQQQKEDKEVNLGEGGFLGSVSGGTGGLDNALLTSGTFTMMSSAGLEEEEELGESGFLGSVSGGTGGLDTALLTSGSFLMMSSAGL